METLVNNYLPLLTGFATKRLSEEFNFQNLNFKDFELTCSYLINQCIDQEFNALFKVPKGNIRIQYYVPTIFTVAIQNFYNNYVDDITDYKIDDIIENEKLRYKIIKVTDEGYNIYSFKKNVQIFVRKEQIKKYLVLDSKSSSSNRKVKYGAQQYREFFLSQFNLNRSLPSKFKHKTVIITKKEIIEELKDFELKGSKVYKAFPFEYIWERRNDSVGREANLPIDTMIYLVDDYRTFRKLLFSGEIFKTKNSEFVIDNVIIIGASKYRDNQLLIAEDLRNKKFKNCILIGKENIDGIPALKKWNWTSLEVNFLNKFQYRSIETKIATNQDLSNKINEFVLLIKSIENEYCIELNYIFLYVRNIMSIIIPSPDSRLNNQVDTLKFNFESKANDFIEDKFFEIGVYEYEEIWEKIKFSYLSILDQIKNKNQKIEILRNLENIDFVIVPKDYKIIWQDELRKLGCNRIKVICFKEFQEYKADYVKSFCFLSFYGREHFASIVNNYHQISLILYYEENQYLEKYLAQHKNELIHEFKSIDRKEISKVEYINGPIQEKISDLIERLYNKEFSEQYNPDMSLSDYEQNFYEIHFGNNDTEIHPGNKSILLIDGNAKRNEKIKNIKVGDKIIIYDNSQKEQLYQLAKDQDNQGRLLEIENNSFLWKRALNDYKSKFNTITELFQNLKSKGLKIKNEQTLRKWLDYKDNVKFPQEKDLRILKTALTNDEFREKFNLILKSKKDYSSIMIALGKVLSDEIMEYVINKQKGINLKRFSDAEINSFINSNASERRVNNIKLVSNESYE